MDNQKDSYFYLSATEEKLIANENSNGSSLAHQHANKKILQNAPYRRFLGEITKLARSKEVQETSELEIIAKTLDSRNKNIFSAS